MKKPIELALMPRPIKPTNDWRLLDPDESPVELQRRYRQAYEAWYESSQGRKMHKEDAERFWPLTKEKNE